MSIAQPKSTPYLSPAERVTYLYQRGYFPQGSISDQAQEKLSAVNFHFFLGYARNYLKIANSRSLTQPRSIEDVFQIIETDHQASNLAFSALRQAELSLRASLVETYCQLGYSPEEHFLAPENFRDMGESSTPEGLVQGIAQQIIRYREPFVVKHLEARAQELELQLPLSRQASLPVFDLLGGLPLWAVVDSLQLGTLSRFMTQLKPLDEKKELWKEVARRHEIPAQIFQTNLTSLATFRNQVAHYNRLWMKPTTDSPKKPKKFEKELRSFQPDPKSMILNFYNIGLFLTPEQRKGFFEQLRTLLEVPQNQLYRIGVTDPLLRRTS